MEVEKQKVSEKIKDDKSQEDKGQLGAISKIFSGKKWLQDGLVIGLLLLINLLLVGKHFSSSFDYAFSAPVVPMLATGLGWFGVELEVAVRAVLLWFYILGSVTLYLLVYEVTNRRASAVLAAVLYSLPILKSRFEALTVLGDGAHIAALTLAPLAAFFLLRFLKKGLFGAAVLSSIMVLLAALTSPFGLFVMMAVLVVITFSEMLLGSGRLRMMRFVWVLLIAAGLSAFWYNPEFVQESLFSPSGKVVVAAVKNLIPLSLFMIPILGSFGYLIFDKRPQLQPLFIALGLTIIFGLISFAGGLARFAVSAQSRYYPELSLAIAFLWGVVGVFVYDLIGLLPEARWFPIPTSKRKLLRKALVVIFIVFCVVVIVAFPFQEMSYGRSRRTEARGAESVVIDIAQIRELTGGSARIVGYVISGFTVLVVGRVFWWLKGQKKAGI